VVYNPRNGVSIEMLIPPTSTEEANGSTLSFHNINYELEIKPSVLSKLPYCKATQKKSILSNISGTFKRGMNAILGKCISLIAFNIKYGDKLGPTGCGKSTLLDILADRKNRGAYQGNVLINDRPRPASSMYRYMVGYVVQDDIFSETLTVHENILFSANLRLPQSVTHAERLERVQRIIEQLGLSECADTCMGTEFQRGVSGGERKRTCIAMEMVLSPSILFLDEPTTGKQEKKIVFILSSENIRP